MNKKIPVLLGAVILLIAVSAWLLSMKAKNTDTGATTTDQTEISPSAQSVNAVIKGPIGIVDKADGKYLVTKDGMTLYVSSKDENPSGTVKVTCNAACEKNWPPYLFDQTVTLDQNSDPLLSKINIFTRADGTQQYAIGTQPLYTYVGDVNAGDISGQGMGNVWMVARP